MGVHPANPSERSRERALATGMVHFQGRVRQRRVRRPPRMLPLLLIASANSAAGLYQSKGHFIVAGYEDDFDAGELQRLKRLFANGTDTSLVSVVAMCISCEGNMNIDFEVLSETKAAAGTHGSHRHGTYIRSRACLQRPWSLRPWSLRPWSLRLSKDDHAMRTHGMVYTAPCTAHACWLCAVHALHLRGAQQDSP